MNKADKIRYAKISEQGCIICELYEGTYSPCEIHHLSPRKHNQRTIGLCFLHHREGSSKPEYVSRHPFKFEFEERYKSEEKLLEITNKLIDEQT